MFRYGHACTEMNGEIWLTGGVGDDFRTTNTVSVFNLASSSWRSVESMQNTRSRHTMHTLNNSPAVFGGFRGEDDTMEVYTPGVGWVVTIMQYRHSYHASVVVPCP